MITAGGLIAPPVLVIAFVLGLFNGNPTPTPTTSEAGGAPATAPTSAGQVCQVDGSAAGLTAEQTGNARAIASVALSRGLGEEGVVMGIMTALTESTLINVGHGDAMGPSSRGLFQQMPGWGPEAVRMDPAGSAGLFFDALAKVPNWQSMSPWTAAQTVQQSEFTDGSNYHGNYQLATQITAQLLAAKTGSSTCGGPATGTVTQTGVTVALPAAAGVAGTVTAPTVTVATAISAGLAQLGVTYAWGGGDANGPTLGIRDGGEGDAHGDFAKVGFDCAGLMLYLWAQVGLSAPRDSQAQAHQGTAIDYAAKQPGDMIGFPGHIALYVGNFGGTDYMLEAPYSGAVVRVAPVRSDHYATVARIWAGTS